MFVLRGLYGGEVEAVWGLNEGNLVNWEKRQVSIYAVERIKENNKQGRGRGAPNRRRSEMVYGTRFEEYKEIESEIEREYEEFVRLQDPDMEFFAF